MRVGNGLHSRLFLISLRAIYFSDHRDHCPYFTQCSPELESGVEPETAILNLPCEGLCLMHLGSVSTPAGIFTIRLVLPYPLPAPAYFFYVEPSDD